MEQIMPSAEASPAPRRSNWKRWLWRAAGIPPGFVIFYAAFVLLGYITINHDYQVPSESDRVIIFVRSNEIHTDLVLPLNDPQSDIDWRAFFPAEHFRDDIRQARYVALGWGERVFYMQTPTWQEAKIGSVCGALFLPSESVLHVEFLSFAGADTWTREVHVSRAQYETLVEHIQTTLRHNKHQRPISAGETTYGSSDHFYEARGSYHMFNTCNQWTGRALQRAGVPTGIWTPLKDQVLRPLPRIE
jgi:uncharacterized protein (TIGR02117 family)